MYVQSVPRCGIELHQISRINTAIIVFHISLTPRPLLRVLRVWFYLPHEGRVTYFDLQKTIWVLALAVNKYKWFTFDDHRCHWPLNFTLVPRKYDRWMRKPNSPCPWLTTSRAHSIQNLNWVGPATSYLPQSCMEITTVVDLYLSYVLGKKWFDEWAVMVPGASCYSPVDPVLFFCSAVWSPYTTPHSWGLA